MNFLCAQHPGAYQKDKRTKSDASLEIRLTPGSFSCVMLTSDHSRSLHELGLLLINNNSLLCSLESVTGWRPVMKVTPKLERRNDTESDGGCVAYK